MKPCFWPVPLCILGLAISAGRASSQIALQAPVIPITLNCGDRIQAPGRYVLVQDLDCTTLTNAGLPALEIRASDVECDLQGFTLRGVLNVSDVTKVKIANGTLISESSTGAGNVLTALHLANVKHARIERITLRNLGLSGTGISVDGGGNNLFLKSDIQSRFIAFSARSADALSIIQTRVFGGHAGLWAQGVSDVVIVASPGIHGGDYSAAYVEGTGSLIEDCKISGRLLVNGSSNTIRNNTVLDFHLFQEAHSSPSLGVGGTANLIEGNVVTNPFGGLAVGGSANVIRGNTVNGAVPPAVDIVGATNTCAENKWQNNTFGTASPDCIR